MTTNYRRAKDEPVELLKTATPDFISPPLWPPNSADKPD